ncbi:hypothetical protein ILUMI_24260 [Ignelater luminosus]|uniref:Uncharacterized protein n=1 Tax=Ignelater luminosus TaxID=2038154 RepID=A0A8K0CAJ9_IGNLU|nr:hypothetical protein ILUMI_24260 [Ignelater luminosus]
MSLLREDLHNLPRHVFGVHSNCRQEVCKGRITTKYERRNEEKAIETFTNITGLIVNPDGLFIYKEKPYLGASPDGLVD